LEQAGIGFGEETTYLI